MHKKLIKHKVSQTNKNSDENMTEDILTPVTSASGDVDLESPKVVLSKKFFKH